MVPEASLPFCLSFITQVLKAKIEPRHFSHVVVGVVVVVVDVVLVNLALASKQTHFIAWQYECTRPSVSLIVNHLKHTLRSTPFAYLVLKESSQTNEKDFKHAGFQQCHLVVVMETFESRDEFGERAHLAHMFHEALGELFQERVLGSAFHGTSLEANEKRTFL